MPQLPDSLALGERPAPSLANGPKRVAEYRPTSGFEDAPAQELAGQSQEMKQAAVFAQRAQIQQATVEAEDKTTQAQAFALDQTYGKDGYMNLKGGDAVNNPILKTYGDKFDAKAQELSQGLSPYAQQIFMRRAQIMGLRLREGIAKHVAGQNDVYAEDVFHSSLAVNIQDAAMNWQSPDAAQLPTLQADNAIYDFASRFGKPEEWVHEQLQRAHSKIADGIVRQAIASANDVSGIDRARSIYDLHSNELVATDRAALDENIKNATYRQLARDTAEMQKEEMLAEKNMKKSQDTNFNHYYNMAKHGKRISDSQLGDMVEKQIISVPMAQMLTSVMKGEGGEDKPEIMFNVSNIVNNPDIPLSDKLEYIHKNINGMNPSSVANFVTHAYTIDHTENKTLLNQSRALVLGATGTTPTLMNASQEEKARRMSADADFNATVINGLKDDGTPVIQDKKEIQIRTNALTLKYWNQAKAPPISTPYGLIKDDQTLNEVIRKLELAKKSGDVTAEDYAIMRETLGNYKIRLKNFNKVPVPSGGKSDVTVIH